MKKMLLALSLVSAMALYADDAAAKKDQAPAKADAPAAKADAPAVKPDKFWQNSDFSQWAKFNRNPKMTLEAKDDTMPAFWILNMFTGKISMETKEDNPQDKYLKLTDCRIYQENKGTGKKYRVVLDAKGTGTLDVYVNRYTRVSPRPGYYSTGKGLGARKVLTVQPTADKWQTFKGEVSKDDAQEILGFVLWAKGEICIDNMYVFPVDDEAK